MVFIIGLVEYAQEIWLISPNQDLALAVLVGAGKLLMDDKIPSDGAKPSLVWSVLQIVQCLDKTEIFSDE